MKIFTFADFIQLHAFSHGLGKRNFRFFRRVQVFVRTLIVFLQDLAEEARPGTDTTQNVCQSLSALHTQGWK